MIKLQMKLAVMLMLFVDGDDREDDNEIKKLKISSFLEHFFHI